VEFEDADAAAKAVELNGQLDLGGRTLKVDSSTGRGGATPGGRSNAGASDGTTIFVKGFDTSGGCWDVEEVKDVLGSCRQQQGWVADDDVYVVAHVCSSNN
jgi:RNA recognition motif-containing protein